ncbi:MAG: dTDP-4-dehydrorhamnose 3,5-epimerase [Candidatus Omnitrophota bacterium]
MPFNFRRLEIPEVILIEPVVFHDERGFFAEIYSYGAFSDFGMKKPFVQENHSKSAAKGVLRGLHFQKDPMAQAKLIKVVSGSILDVALDIRRNSSTFGKWVSTVLSAENKNMLYIPEGFAHGFCTLEENVEVLYKCSQIYAPNYDRGILWNDPALGIDWPVKDPVLSEKDKNWPLLKAADNTF